MARENPLGSKRSDLISPCRGCKDRVPACSQHCDKPEYTRWKALWAKKRADDQRRRDAIAADCEAARQRYRRR